MRIGKNPFRSVQCGLRFNQALGNGWRTIVPSAPRTRDRVSKSLVPTLEVAAIPRGQILGVEGPFEAKD